MKKLFLLLGILLLIPAMVYSTPITIDLNTGIGVSFQDEGTLTADQTTLLRDLDDSWAPATIGTVTHDYYATGGSDLFFDAISLNFDLSSVGWDTITSATLRFYTQKGAYGDYGPSQLLWQHYEILEGAYNDTHEDLSPIGGIGIDFGKGTILASNLTIRWLESDIPVSWITADDFDVTLRLWNARIDKVELSVSPIPEPSTCLLLCFGLIGMIGIKKELG